MDAFGRSTDWGSLGSLVDGDFRELQPLEGGLVLSPSVQEEAELDVACQALRDLMRSNEEREGRLEMIRRRAEIYQRRVNALVVKYR